MPRRKSEKLSAVPSRPDIYRYHDYRLFLRDWFSYRKEQGNPGFSMRELAKKAELSCAYLPLVLADHRTLSAKALEKLSPFLGLDSNERSYLESLRALADGESETVRMDAFKRIQQLRSYRERNPKEVETYRYLEKWFYVAIREMAAVPEFRADPSWIAPRLKGRVTVGEIKEALAFLTDHGYLDLRSDGTVAQREKNIDCVAGIYRLALRNFHRQMHTLSGEILDSNLSLNERYLNGYTFAFPANRFEEIRKIIDDTVLRLEEIGKTAVPSDTVYHIELTAVPLTNRRKGKKNEKV